MLKWGQGNARKWLLAVQAIVPAPARGTALSLVLVVAVLTRLGLWAVYPLTSNNDSPTYVGLSRNILNKGFSAYNATRSPGYPLFLAMTGTGTYPTQLALGLATTVLIYFIGARLSGRAWFGALAGLLHTLNIGQLFFEATMLTETLTTFLLTAALFAAFVLPIALIPMRELLAIVPVLARPIVPVLARPRRFIAVKRPYFFILMLYAFLAGLAASLAGMVRPLFAYLPVLISVFYLLPAIVPVLARPIVPVLARLFAAKFPALRSPTQQNPGLLQDDSSLGAGALTGRQRTCLSIAAILPAVLIFGWWLNYVNSNYKIMSFDTIGGFRWLNHTGEYFEYVPDQDAVIRDTYIKYRNARIIETGSQSNAAWDAMDELQKKSKLGFYALSRKLTNISLNLISAHPDLYLKNVISGWWMFWWAAVYWSSDVFAWQALVPVMKMLIFIERAVMILANLLFMGGSLAAVFWKKARVVLGLPFDWNNSGARFGWLVLATAWGASVVQTLMDHGDNPRYLVPLQTIVMMMVAWWLCQIFSPSKIHSRKD